MCYNLENYSSMKEQAHVYPPPVPGGSAQRLSQPLTGQLRQVDPRPGFCRWGLKALLPFPLLSLDCCAKQQYLLHVVSKYSHYSPKFYHK